MQDRQIPAVIMGVPLDLGAQNLGVDVGPEAFRRHQIIEKLTHIGFEVTDNGNVKVEDRNKLSVGNPRLKYLDEITRVNQEVAQQTFDAITNGRKVIALGGDHSLNLGVVSGASTAVKGNIGLIYLDAHGDMNTEETTLTGNIHGMHLASLMGFGAAPLIRVFNDNVKLPKNNLLHIGGSDWDQGELELVKRENLRTFTLFDLLSHGLAPLLHMIDELALRVPNIWISLDLDVIDRVYAPGAGMPNARGLTYREIAAIAEYIGQRCQNIIGIDVVEYNPLQDDNGKTAELGIELIAKFFGKDYSWYTNYMDRNPIQA